MHSGGYYTFMEKFTKSERLCSRKVIENLFSSGHNIYNYPFRLVWLASDEEEPFPAKMAVSVPVRRIKKAVTRNRVKRLIRESYRSNKVDLYRHLNARGMRINLMLIFISGTVYDYGFINLKLAELIEKFSEENATDKESN